MALARRGRAQALDPPQLELPRALNFEPKAARVLDVYAREFDGQELKPDEFVISADEKTSIQARIRCHATVAANSRHPMLVEHEYERGGSLSKHASRAALRMPAPTPAR